MPPPPRFARVTVAPKRRCVRPIPANAARGSVAARLGWTSGTQERTPLPSGTPSDQCRLPRVPNACLRLVPCRDRDSAWLRRLRPDRRASADRQKQEDRTRATISVPVAAPLADGSSHPLIGLAASEARKGRASSECAL